MEMLRTLITWFVITIIIDAYLMTLPKPFFKHKEYPPEFHIKQNNRIDIQKRYECAAFSSAFILRHLNIEANGEELYKNFPSKMRSGCVYPKGIRTFLKKHGIKTNYFKGNINTLKHHIYKNNPVIVFIKVQKGSSMLHYVPVIGYDQDYFYLAESIGQLVNSKGMHYNRKISIEEFKKLWNIKNLLMPVYSNTYITIEG